MSLSAAADGLRLTLVRHGRAEDKSPGQGDFDRALDRRGVAEVAAMARRCLDLGLVPDLLRASAAVRTRQTAESFARVLSVPAVQVSLERELYLAEPDALLGCIRATPPGARHLMLVGHNPGLAELAQQFAPQARLAGFETAATCTIRLGIGSWDALRPGEAAEVHYESPPRFQDLWS
jgi:phosphohistidine phosphatase